jgi:hypothetical protein
VTGTEPLARVIATAFEEARRLDEERVREIVREELAAAPVAGRDSAAPEWLTRPKAARAVGMGVKRFRKLLKRADGQIRTRQPEKLIEVFMPSVRDFLQGNAAVPTDAAAWARARLARGGK